MSKSRKPQSYVPPCEECGGRCCRYVAIEIDKPTTKKEYDNIRWYLLHANVCVFVDHNKVWHVEFRSDCDAQNKNGRCAIYDDRPTICRAYGTSEGECEYYDSPYLHYFENLAQYEEYMDGQGRDWRFRYKK